MLSHERNNTQAQGKDIRDGDVAREKLMRGRIVIHRLVFLLHFLFAIRLLVHLSSVTRIHALALEANSKLSADVGWGPRISREEKGMQ